MGKRKRDKFYWFAKESYFTDLDKVKPRVKLNGSTTICPKCGGLLLRDLNDLACINCGWRESCFYGAEYDVVVVNRTIFT